MPTEPNPNKSNENSSPRELLWIERVILKDGGRLRPIIRIVLFVAAIWLVSLEIGSVIFGYTHGMSIWWQLFYGSLARSFAYLALSWIFVRLIDGRPFSSLGLTFRRGWPKELGIGFGVGAALQLLVMAILVGTRSVHYSGGVVHDFLFWKRVAFNAVLFFFAASVEELSFRGYAFQRLVDSVGTGTAIVASAVLFGLAHMGNPSATFFSTLNTVLAGIVLTVPYIRTRSMWAQLGLHWSWNLTMATIVSLPVSGIGFAPNLFVAQIGRWPWLNGGAYGPEGGAVVTIVSVVGIAWLVRTRYLTPSQQAQEDLQ
jgi:membrane protease YdiL (CAAX protease family)